LHHLIEKLRLRAPKLQSSSWQVTRR